MFQKKVVEKYLSKLDKDLLKQKYDLFCSIFKNEKKIENIRNSKEEQYQEGFIRDLFVSVLGYTIKPEENYNILTELKNEVANKSNSKKSDGAICEENNENKIRAVIELKGTDTTDLDKVAFQAFSYKNFHNECNYVIVSNFERLRIYVETQIEFEEFNLFTLSFERFCILYLLLELNQLKADIPLKLKHETLSEEKQITDNFYADYSTFKRLLFEDLCENNLQSEECHAELVSASDDEIPNQVRNDDGKINKLLLFKKTQKLLDRILFILFCEDRNLLPANSVAGIISDYQKLREMGYGQSLYNVFKTYFDRIDKGYKNESDSSKDVFAYNGGLFKTDEVLDNIKIGDHVLLVHAKRLADYDFESQISVDILGRIFENSLTEIEEVQKEIEAEKTGEKVENNNVGKRKKDGVFYTPEYITKYIVENTIGKLCEEKREELKINDEEFTPEKSVKTGDDKKTVAAKQKITAELDKRLETYRAWLLDLKILDPACGSGAFLNAALQQLKIEHTLIDYYWSNIHAGELNFTEIENTILENNLYGVDINEESVEIAKLSLWLHTAKKNRKLTTLNGKIKCGNSLIDDPTVAGEKAFKWEEEFPEVFAKGGFDVVIGNPPYVTRNLDQFTKTYINKNYETAEYQVDLYISFIEKGIKLLNHGGYNSFIVPNSWLKNLMMENCRKFMLEKLNVSKIITSKKSIFKDASVDSLIYIGNISDKQTENIDVSEIQDKKFIFKHSVSKDHIRKNDKFIFDIEVNHSIIPIIEKMKMNVSKINDLFDVCRGINPYDKYTGQSPEIIASRAYHADYKKDDTFVPELKGRHIDRYSENWDEKSFISYGDWLAAPRESKYFTGKRIVFREILGKTLITTVLTKDIKIDRSLYIALPLNENVDVYFVDGILNSPLMSFYFRYSNNEFDELFPKMRVAEFRELPIKNTSSENQQQISLLVKKMLSLNETLQKKSTNFLKVVKQTFALEKISTKLETFYNLDFDGFMKELKQKLTPKTKLEWLEVFEETKKSLQEIQSQIAATDKEINALVYKLYGLTEEEIKIVEGR